MRNKTPWFGALTAIAVAALILTGPATATPLTQNPDLTREGVGLTIVEDGAGLEGLGAGSAILTVDIGGPVQAAYLYWAGRDRPCPRDAADACEIPFEPYLDQELIFDGVPVTGTIIGTEANGTINNIGYRVDVTEIVTARGTGLQSIPLQDGNLGLNLYRLNGAGLIVIYEDLSDPVLYSIMVYEGLDFAFGSAAPDPSPAVNVTDPVTFVYDAGLAGPAGDLIIFAGDAELERPDRIEISGNPDLVNQLAGADGISWDTLTLSVNTSGTGSTTVQLFSEPVDQNPDSLLWELGALRVPLFPPALDIDIRKQAEGPDTRTFPSGSAVTFEIVVTNTGEADLINVTVTDPMAPECDQLIGDLAVGASVTYYCTVFDVVNSFENEACVEGEGQSGEMVDDCDPSTVEIIDIDIRKQEEGPDSRTVPAGSDVTFEIVVTNTGDEDLFNVTVTDLLTPDCDRFIGDLAAGASVTYTCTAPGVVVGFTNEACVEGERNGVMVGDCDPSTVEVPPALGCRMTGGGVDTDLNWDHTFEDGSMIRNGAGHLPPGIDRYTFGGQAGASTALPPQPSGEWTHHQQRGPSGRFTFHGGTSSAPPGTRIVEIRCSDPDNCVPARTAPAKQLDFDGIGVFHSIGSGGNAPQFEIADANVTPQGHGSNAGDETFHWFEVNVDDLGERGGFNSGAPDSETCPSIGFGEKGALELAACECPDFYRITIYDGVDAETLAMSGPNTTDVIYEVYGYVDGGNLQIHPLTGHDTNGNN